VAGPLSQRRPQFLRGPIAVGQEGGTAVHVFHQPGRAPLAGFEIAGEMHAAHHALPGEFGRARQQLRAALRQQVGQ
jgi:hypothetical protein